MKEGLFPALGLRARAGAAGAGAAGPLVADEMLGPLVPGDGIAVPTGAAVVLVFFPIDLSWSCLPWEFARRDAPESATANVTESRRGVTSKICEGHLPPRVVPSQPIQAVDYHPFFYD